MPRIPFIICILLAIVHPCQADGVEVRLRPSVVLAGQPAILEIETDNTMLDRLPQPPSIPGVEFRHQGNSRIRRDNTIRIIAYYAITPDRTGNITIPAFPVRLADGRSMPTKPLELVVVPTETLKAPEPNLKMHCLLLTPRTSYYTGEQFSLQALVLVDSQLFLRGIDQPQLPRNGFAIDRLDNPLQGDLTMFGRQWRSFSYSARATATAPGTVNLGPLEAKATIGIPADGGNGFFQRYNDFSLSVHSEPLALTIKPYPAGAPSGFAGAVGEFTLSASFDPAPTRADEPVAVRLLVSGNGDPAQITTPVLENESAWEIFDGAREEGARDPSDTHCEVSFRRILRPHEKSVATIPPFGLVYLNPDTGSYETARSNPLLLPTNLGPAVAAAQPLPAPPPPAPLPPASTVDAGGLLLSLPSGIQPRWAKPTTIWMTSGWIIHGLCITIAAGLALFLWQRKYAATPEGIRANCRKNMRKRLHRIARLPDREIRLLETRRWVEDWRHSPLSRQPSAKEQAIIDSLTEDLNITRYARTGREAGHSTAPSVPTLVSLLNPSCQ